MGSNTYDAYPASRYGIQHGTVVVISTDARKNDEGNWVFAILVKPDRHDLEFNEKRHQLSSGMTARIEIITDERRLISCFVALIVAAFQGSLGES
jgi:hemolysin D